MRSTWSFHTAGQITFGPGVIRQIGELVARHKLARIFVVTDKNLVDAGIVDRACEPLRSAGMTVEVFDGSAAEPSINVALNSIEQARGFQPDAIVGLGARVDDGVEVVGEADGPAAMVLHGERV